VKKQDYTRIAARPLEDNEAVIEIGARCRLSALGSQHMPRQTRSNCTVVGSGMTKNQVRVKFDGSKTARTLHRSYLEVIALKKSKN